MEENYTDIDEIIAKVSNIGRGGGEGAIQKSKENIEKPTATQIIIVI